MLFHQDNSPFLCVREHAEAELTQVHWNSPALNALD